MVTKNIQSLNFTRLEIKIIRYVFRHYKDKLNARQLARILRINHANATKLCKALVKKRLLIKEELGNAVYYMFNYKDSLAIKLMEYLLSLENTEFPDWLAVTFDSLTRFDPYLEFGCVFGSSINSMEFNDIDILLVYNKKNTNKIKKIKEEIRKSRLIDKPIRYVDISMADIQINKGKQAFYKIMSENLVFCNAEKYVEAITNAADR